MGWVRERSTGRVLTDTTWIVENKSKRPPQPLTTEFMEHNQLDPVFEGKRPSLTPPYETIVDDDPNVKAARAVGERNEAMRAKLEGWVGEMEQFLEQLENIHAMEMYYGDTELQNLINNSKDLINNFIDVQAKYFDVEVEFEPDDETEEEAEKE